MKKRKMVYTIFLFVVLTVFSVKIAAQDVIIQKNELPAKAQNFLNKHFSNYGVGYIKKDEDLFSVDYEVNFSNGMEIKFDSGGDWEEIDGEHQAIPTGYIMEPIKNYVRTQFPNTKIVGIERKTWGGFEVKISNGLELHFSSSGKFTKIDD